MGYSKTVPSVFELVTENGTLANIPAAAGDISIGFIPVSDPVLVNNKIVSAYIDFYGAQIKNTSALGTNATDGLQYIQVAADVTFINAIKIASGSLLTAASGTRPGFSIGGNIDISTEVKSAIATTGALNVQWTAAKAVRDELDLYDVFANLRVYTE